MSKLLDLAAAVLLAGVALSAQEANVDARGKIYKAVAPANRSYVGPSVAPFEHENQRYSLFVPTTPPPPGGYPVLLHTELGAFVDSPRRTLIGEKNGFVFRALEHGWAVIWAAVTVSRGPGTRNPIDEPSGVGYGPAYKGNGVFVPPTVEMPDDFSGDVHPYFDPSRPMPEKDIVMLVQHIKENAGSDALPVDASAIVLHARSGAGMMSWWIAAGPDRSGVWTSPKGQEHHDTRVRGAILRSSMTWWDVLSRKRRGVHFPRDERRLPGDSLYDQGAGLLARAPQDWLVHASALSYAQDEQASPGITRDVHGRAFFLTHEEVAVQTNVTPPYPSDVEENPHTAWSGAAFKTRFCNTLFAGFTGGDAGFEDLVDYAAETADEIDDELLVWLDGLLAGKGPTWTDLDGGLAGARGEPFLLACGDLEQDTSLTFEIGNARPGTSGSLVAGLGELNAPFKGGLLVPAPTFVLTLPALDKNGAWSLAVNWPGAPSGVSIVVQAWLVDDEAKRGLSATNAVRATTP